MPTRWRIVLVSAALLFTVGAAPVAAEIIHACFNTTNGELRRVSDPGNCRVNEAYFNWNNSGSGSSTELVLILEDHFETGWVEPSIWNSALSGTGKFYYDPPGYVVLSTEQGYSAVTLSSKQQFALASGDLVFKTQLSSHSNPDGSVWGNGQPRGLVAGTDRGNAIEFVSVSRTSITCRTVKDGTATETTFSGGPGGLRSYQIVAKTDEVKFFFNGELVATHTTNIPAVPLNVYFSTINGGPGNAPIWIDFVRFERRL